MEVTENKPNVASKKRCICAPPTATSRAGSFRCHLHRTTEQKSEENHSDKDGSCENLEFVKMTMHRKLSYNKPQLSRFGRAAAFSLKLQSSWVPAGPAQSKVSLRDLDCKFRSEDPTMPH
ncbi:unnamed protein product [Dovyalis caffra]|uniref:Uncharacterized protein n=1 Tax=Dovyalis caffra TaxID=77055 RepID=A0AAV1QXS6_9ROSI|nr:unnamed protein product [Dovyalis caffra]